MVKLPDSSEYLKPVDVLDGERMMFLDEGVLRGARVRQLSKLTDSLKPVSTIGGFRWFLTELKTTIPFEESSLTIRCRAYGDQLPLLVEIGTCDVCLSDCPDRETK